MQTQPSSQRIVTPVPGQSSLAGRVVTRFVAAALFSCAGAVVFGGCYASEPPERRRTIEAVESPLMAGDFVEGDTQDSVICTESCESCSADAIEQWLDAYLADDSAADAVADSAEEVMAAAELMEEVPGTGTPMTPKQKSDLEKCFSISDIIKYDPKTFNCAHYSYYVWRCLKRKGFDADQAGLYCKDCTNPDYKEGRIGHAVIGMVVPGNPVQCCMVEPQKPWPDSKRFCEDGPCTPEKWKSLREKAAKMYCEGDPEYWFPGDTRKAGCKVSSSRWDNDAPDTPCTADQLACLKDAGIEKQ